jgi:hypothetical protein
MQTHDSGNALEIIISYSMNSIYFIRTIESIAINGSFNLMQWRINYMLMNLISYFKISGTPINEYRSTLKTRRWLSLRDDPIMRVHAVLKWISSWKFFSLPPNKFFLTIEKNLNSYVEIKRWCYFDLYGFIFMLKFQYYKLNFNIILLFQV